MKIPIPTKILERARKAAPSAIEKLTEQYKSATTPARRMKISRRIQKWKMVEEECEKLLSPIVRS